MIHGRPGHPQGQGLIEQARGVLKQKLRAWMAESGSLAWAQGLPVAITVMNCRVCYL